MKIVLLEDDDALRSEWAEALGTVADLTGDEVSIEVEDDVAGFVQRLENRREEARRAPQDEPFEGSNVDSADLLVVDYDLTLAGVALTGRRVSYLARCYSSCGVVMLLNERGDNWFDVRLRGDLEAFAQLPVGGRQLANPGLWSGVPTPYFRPWQWPVIAQAVRDQAARVEIVNGNLYAPAMETVGVPGAVVDAMPRSLVEALSTHVNLREATFDELATSQLRRKDTLGAAGRASLIAAQLASWLEAIVLPGQNVLVDAPHLVARYPSLLSGPAEELSSWDRTANLSRSADGLGMHADILAEAAPAAPWLSRPTWFWSVVSENQDIAEVRDPWGSRTAPFAFAEDLSRFVPVDAVRTFTADVDSPFVRRFARGPVEEDPFGRGVEYLPSQRFAMHS
ncbi:MAG: hypothetical protein M3333_04705 [Actinomycetota bacterium]|nr:hypothetical protein [Actinomycetota bacterium]